MASGKQIWARRRNYTVGRIEGIYQNLLNLRRQVAEDDNILVSAEVRALDYALNAVRGLRETVDPLRYDDFMFLKALWQGIDRQRKEDNELSNT